MLKLTNKTSLIIALFLAAAASIFIYIYTTGEEATADMKKVPVVVAAADIPANKAITGDMVSVQKIPAAYAHPSAFRDTKDVEGKISKAPLLAGEQLLASKVAAKGQKGNRFSYNIPDQYRALTMKVNEVTGVGGFPTVGDRVDILLTGGEGGKVTTRTILQKKEILATGGVIFPQEDGKQRVVPTITLSVTPEEAQQITLAESKGKIKYTLRPPEDKEKVNLQPVASID